MSSHTVAGTVQLSVTLSVIINAGQDLTAIQRLTLT